MISIRTVLAEARILARDAINQGMDFRINIAPDIYDMLKQKEMRVSGKTITIISDGWELWTTRYVYRQNNRIINGFYLELL